MLLKGMSEGKVVLLQQHLLPCLPIRHALAGLHQRRQHELPVQLPTVFGRLLNLRLHLLVRAVQNGHLKSKLLIKALVDPVVLRNITHKNTPVLQYMTVV